jgi:hypothetical protein
VRRTVAEDLYVFRGGAPVAVAVATGITDGTFTEVQSDQLRPGDLVIVGLEQPRQRANLQPPPGMGGGGFGGSGRRR